MIAVWPPADVWCFAKYRGMYVFGVVIVSSVARNSPRSCDCPRICERNDYDTKCCITQRLQQNKTTLWQQQTSIRKIAKRFDTTSNLTTVMDISQIMLYSNLTLIIIKWCRNVILSSTITTLMLTMLDYVRY